DVILTGTPAGASVVSPGDVVEVEVSVEAEPCQSTGRLSSPIESAAEPLRPWGAMPRADSEARSLAAGGRGSVSGVEFRYGRDVEVRLRALSTATIASQLHKRGIDGTTMDGLVAIRPEEHLLGRAHTLRYVPRREDLEAQLANRVNAQKRAIEELLPGDVLVIECGGRSDAGTIGDILALRAKVRGAAGVVTDGAVRDSRALADVGLPVYHRGVHPGVLGRRHIPWETGSTIVCAGVTVQPGDVIVGDADGVAVVPDALVAEIAAAATEQELQERFIAEQVAKGEAINGLYPLGDRWQGAYRAWRRSEGR
ncbi:MAG TPA: hypothetical protein VMD59_17205, partial [Acidimicrobiales bacterium]|nr:hypothetical protein [Acidimicrobiales bacterium]